MKHILITGTGRAGTTLLVQLFTTLGFDTGYCASDFETKVDPIARAGLEPSLKHDRLPHVIKAPGQADRLATIFQRPDFELEAAIIPIRDLFSAAESRRNVYRMAAEAGAKKPELHPGSLWETRDPNEQEAKLSTQFYRCLYLVTQAEAPLYMLHFPRFVSDADYLYRALEPVLAAKSIDVIRLRDALTTVARPDLVTQFEPKVPSFRSSSTGMEKALSGGWLSWLRAKR